MKRFWMGLAGALVALTAASASYAAPPKDDSATAVPALIAAGKVPCTVTAQRFIAEGTMSDKTKGKFYEVACKEGLGYVVIDHENATTPPTAFDCISTNEQHPPGSKDGLNCTLPGNTNAVTALQPVITKLGEPCTVTKVHGLGSSPEKSYFELACDSGAGYIVVLPRVVGSIAPADYNCLDMDPKGNIKCTLNNPDAFASGEATKLLAASGKPCVMTQKRYVGGTTDGSTFFEVACQSGDGYMLEEARGGKFKEAIGCVDAFGVLGGCTLTDARVALTKQNALYSSLSKAAGFNCDVAKYAAFPPDGKNDVVELKCSNRPDGGVGVFPLRGGKAMVYDCVRAQNVGYRCSFTDSTLAPVYADYTQKLIARGRRSCVVSGARPFGASATNDFVEVACADGGPGWVIEFPLTSSTPNDLLNCAQAASAGEGGCQLPTNQKK